MAITAEKISSNLVLQVETDTAPDGSAVYSSRTISKIDPALSNEDAYDFAAAVGTLQSFPVGSIQRTEKSVLSRA